ncbi:polysaccharide deacetylase family protein [Roseibium hamelinense]|nr:polysaccharide deacetylase family protein [Roseibium hamelinense]
MFHEFVTSPDNLLDQGCRVSDLEAALRNLSQSGWDFVTLGEAIRRISSGNPNRFVVLTYDDGYRSNIELALPVMEKYNAPATIYVPTQMMTRDINAWWLGLRVLARDNDRIEFDPMGLAFECVDLPSKIAALRRMVAWVWEDFRRVEHLARIFEAYKVSVADEVERTVLTEDEMMAADRHPLIEIGAHTTTHRALALLSEADAEEDIDANKRYLESKLDREVPHFAFPYGAPSIAGTREAEICKKLGFETAVTTEPGALFPEHAGYPFLLPRQDAENTVDGQAHITCGVNGVFRALASRLGDPVVRPDGFSE